LGSGVVPGPSRHQACDKGAEQGFAASARIVHELKEAEVIPIALSSDFVVMSGVG